MSYCGWLYGKLRGFYDTFNYLVIAVIILLMWYYSELITGGWWQVVTSGGKWQAGGKQVASRWQARLTGCLPGCTLTLPRVTRVIHRGWQAGKQFFDKSYLLYSTV